MVDRLVERLVERLGEHAVLAIMLMTRTFGVAGGMLVIYYVELACRLPHQVRVHFWITSAVVVTVAVAASLLMSLWETRHLRRLLRELHHGRSPAPQLARAGGTEAVRLPSRHHWHESWLVPLTTYVPCIITLKILDDIPWEVVENITAACFMAISMAVMSHYFATDRCVQTLMRYLLNRGVTVDYRTVPAGKLRLRLTLCFILIIITTALMIGTQARQRTADILRRPDNPAEALTNLRVHSTYITIVAAATGFVFSSLLAKSVSSRVNRLVEAMERVERGQLSERVHATGTDEIDVLTRQFNEMVAKLQSDDQIIRDLNANLEQKVTERTQQLEDTVQQLKATQQRLTEYNEQLDLARREAEAASRAKSQFVTNISHELRTPLNGVIGLTDLLSDTTLDEHQQKYVRTIKYSGETLLTLINEILDFSKIEAGMLQLENVEFDVLEAVESVIEVLAHRCSEKSLELVTFVDPQIPMALRGDPARLKQILTNLTNNAVKFTERGEVILETEMAEDRDENVSVRFQVTDTGIGIPKDRLKDLFRPFTQADASTTRKYGGTGLGLTISKELCEMMGGWIDVESEPDKGSTFQFVLPFNKPQKQQETRKVVPHNIRGMRALVVDPSANCRRVLERQLNAWSLASETAESPETAQRMLAEATAAGDPFRLVLLDRKSYEGPNSPLAKTIKKLPEAEQPMVLLMVPLTQLAHERSSGNQHVTDYVSKPITPSELFNTIMKAAVGEERPSAAPSRRPSPASSQFPKSRWPNARILLAEDNEVNQYVASQMLAKAGYECVVAGNGHIALEALEKESFDLVLMDCHMPEMDGLTATRIIRQRLAENSLAQSPRLPIIALTANAMRSDRDRCLDAGMSDYLSKPLDPHTLVTMIDSYLEQIHEEVDDLSRGEAMDNVNRQNDLPVLDVTALLQRSMGDWAVLDMVLDMFQNRVADDLEQLAKAVDQRDAAEIKRIAHTLHGASANASAEGVRDAVARLEASADHDRLDDAPRYLAQLQHEWERFQKQAPELIAMERSAAVAES